MTGALRKNCIVSVLLLGLCLLMGGCSVQKVTGPAFLTKTVFAMDTLMSLAVTGDRAEEALALSEQELFRIDALLNRHSAESAVSELNNKGIIENEELASLLTHALLISESTGGAVDCTLAPLIDLWDIAGGGHVPDKSELTSALCLTGPGRVSISRAVVTLAPGTVLDLGAFGKGYAGECVRAIYESCGVTGSIDLGGDCCLVGPKSEKAPLWNVGLRDPGNTEDIIGILAVTDTFTVTSGSYERFFTSEDGTVYHHIIDPSTGSPAMSGLVSVTVLTGKGVEADALATAFFVMGYDRAKEWLSEHPGIGAVFVTENAHVLYSASLQNVFRPESEAYTYEAF